MLAIKKINNNVVICTDSSGHELIAFGKGIGFGELPQEISLAQIDRTFYDVKEQYLALLQELPSDIVEFSIKIVDIARNELPYDLSPNLIISLADHIAFAIVRAKKNLRIHMPLAYDVEQMYPLEYRIGRYAIRQLQKEFKIGLSNDEAVGIAMNLLNGKVEPETEAEQTAQRQDEEMLEDITDIIENHFHFIVERASFNYARYATHMQYLFKRIHTEQEINSSNLKMYKSLGDEFPEVAACVEKISTHMKEAWGCELSAEEKMYLILHVNRICVKEGL